MNYDDELEHTRAGRSRSRNASRGNARGAGIGRSNPGTDDIELLGQRPKRRDTNRQTARGSAAAAKENGHIRNNRNKKKKKKWKIAIIIIEILLLLGIGAFVLASIFLKSKMDLIQRLPFDEKSVQNVELTDEKKEQMKGYWTIAIFGVDDRGSVIGKGTNADVNIICNINHDTGEIKLVSVFRDAYLNISDKNEYNKLNRAYLLGGPEQAVKALNKNMDLDITDYMTFNWKAVAEAINILGGVDLEISKKEFYYINAFITETVKATGIYSTQLKKAGMQHLDGVQAVAYGRLRLMDTDYARTERQRKVITLAFEKAKKADWATLNNIIETVFPNVATSIDTGEVIDAAWNIKKYHLGESGGFPFDKRDAVMGGKGDCVIPQTLESNVIKLHSFLFTDEAYTPTETVKAYSKKIAADANKYKNRKSSGDTEKSTAEEQKETAETREQETGGTKESETSSYGGGNGNGIPESSGAAESTGLGRPGGDASGWEEWPTDANGNPYDPAWGTEGGSTPARPSSPTESGTSGTGGGTWGYPGDGTYGPTEGTGSYPGTEAPSGPGGNYGNQGNGGNFSQSPTTAGNQTPVRPGGGFAGGTTPTESAPGAPGSTSGTTPPGTTPPGNTAGTTGDPSGPGGSSVIIITPGTQATSGTRSPEVPGAGY